MGRLLKITEGKYRHSLSQEVDFINKSLTKVNKAKLKEDRYASLDDELSAIENGGWDMFDNSDLADPDMTDRVHRNASYEGMSDLDYVNREELLDNIEDDLAYEVERNGNINYAETPFRGYKDIFDDMKMELDAEGEVTGNQGHKIKSIGDLANEVLEIEIYSIYEEWGIDLIGDAYFSYTLMERALKRLAPYANDNYPNCKSFFETLMNISKEYNATVTEFNLDWPPLVRIPDQSGTLEENSVLGSLPASADGFLQDVAQMYGGIDYTDIMHFAKKATSTEIRKIQSLRKKAELAAEEDDEEAIGRIAKQAASYVKSVLAESKRRPSKKALKEAYDVNTIDGLAKYAKNIASAVLDNNLYDKTAIHHICETLHCNEDYAAECLDSWIEQEQARRSNLRMVPESKKFTKKRVKESTGGMTARIYLAESVRQEEVSSFIEVMNEYYPEFRIGCPVHAELKISGLNMAQAEDILEEAPDIGAQVGVRVVKVAFEY